jgi:PAS domain S-box-containing protein
MTSDPPIPLNLQTVRGTQLLSSDTREQYRQKLARITLDSMVQFVGLLDAEGTVLEINQVALDAVGIKLSDVEGKPFWTTFWWQVSEEVNAGLRDSIRRASQGEFVRWDTEIYGRAGGKETIIIDASLMPVMDDQGKVVFITAEGRDITEKKAHEREIARQREELAELDKLKTKFFANISHEFRTPLTLMMGPLEDAIAQSEGLSSSNRERLELAHRNSLRLLKLVNTLLDFSRIEAGRIQASYEPTDLCQLTNDLAAAFRSAIERAGMRLAIDCSPLPEPVYVDVEMWEKIVLNLLSNAFKFTFEGEIRVSLRMVGSTAELSVRDTGTGIPAAELPRLFERFHRVKGARGRSYEGSGIGLALVQELIKLHGGSVSVESEINRGSTFTVSIPLGKAHLPADRIKASRATTSTAVSAEAFSLEASRWLPESLETSVDESVSPQPLPVRSPSVVPESEKELLVVADDNADMREYLARLLRNDFRVLAVSNGVQAIEVTRRHHPTLVLTDIMMPGVDGFGVINAIRTDPALSSTPVILLSARAGEESRVEGLEAGADDYLVKPFTARELIARVSAHVKMAALRRQTEKSRRLYDTILSNTPDLAYVFDLNHRFIYANRALLTMWGKTWEESIGKNCLELGYEPWHAEMHDREIEQVIATRKPIRGEVPFNGTNGRRIYDYIFVPVFGPGGDVEAIAGTTRDTTDRAIAEEALRHSEERFRAFVNATSNVVYRMSPDWSEMRQLQGKDFIADTSEPIRDWLQKYIHPEDQPRINHAIEEAIRTRSNFELEHRVLRVDGSMGWTSSRAVPLLDNDGTIREWFGAAADVTERKDAEEALRRSEKLAATGRLAATIAHEINNPLEAVTNLLYLAKHTSNRNETQAYLDAAEEELGRVSQLAKQTLGFYRETKGTSSVQVGSIVSSLLNLFSSRVKNKGITVNPEILGDPAIYVVPGEIRQLIANLISNSIDAVERGGHIRVRVSTAKSWDKDRTTGVRLTIADNGAGISQQTRTQLFQPFVTTKKDVGTGLGLWVCKSIVEKHHGSINVKSSTQPGNSWTVFSVFLPTTAQPLQGAQTLDQAV